MKKNIIKNKNILYIVSLITFSILINQYYGYKGILPIDSFLIFNSGFDILNGYYPFKDYWTIKEPFIDLLQALFFKVFGVSWFAYVFHASVFNCLITIATYIVLKKFNLNQNLSFFYSVSVALLTYPTAGTPFSDHHTLIFCMLSFYLFILAIKENKNLYWFLIPVFLGFSVLSKQAPTIYFIILISFLSIIYFIYTKKISNLIFASLGLMFILLVFFIGIYLVNIDIKDFFYQYYLYPQSLGGSRLEWLFPLEFQRLIWRFKLQYLSIAILIFILVKFSIKSKKLFLSDYITLIGLISICIVTVIHQLMTINAIFIYCLIPIFCGFSHTYLIKFYYKKSLNYFLIFLTIGSTIYYYTKYVNNRTFMDLRGVNLNNSIDGKLIHPGLSKIKWITMFYPNNPVVEVENLKFAISVLKDDKTNKMLITDYQFISVFLNEYDFSVTRFWYDFHGYPQKNNRYFSYWKQFVIKQIKKNNIKYIYVLKPLHGEKKPLENILVNCYRKEVLSKVLYKLILKNC